MAYKTDKTSKELKIMLNENTVESKELKELIVDLVQFSIIIGKSINKNDVIKAVNLAKKWKVTTGKQPKSIADFQRIKQMANFDLMGFINYEASILTNLDFFDIQHDLKRNF